MSFLPDLNGEFCLRLTLTLLHFIWQGAAIALLATGAGAALRRAGAAARYWVFVAALGAMALCPLVTYHTLTRLEEETGAAVPQTALSSDPDGGSGGDAGMDSGTGLGGMGLGAGLKPAPAGVGAQDGGVSQPGDETRTSSPPLPPVGAGVKPVPAGEQPQPDGSLLKRVSQSVSRAFASDAYARVAPWVAGGYFAGVLAMLARLLLALRGGRGLRRHALPVTEPALRTVFTRAAAALHLRVLPAVAWCERVAVPTVVGLLKPTILLPLSLSSGFTPDQIEMLLLHELAHLRRHDHWVNLAQWVVETAMFFHPAVWWVSRRIRAERELACDDCVLATGVAEASYADSLLRMAELSRRAAACDDPTVALALGSHGSRFSEFGHRVLRLIEGRESLESLRPARVWPVVLALILLLAGCYTIAHRAEPEDTRRSNDPLGIQYRGLQVGLGDSLYNPNGEKIGERLNWQYGFGSGEPREIMRRFIFDFPETPEPIFFDSLGFSCGGTRANKRDWKKKVGNLPFLISVPGLIQEMNGQTPQVIADVPCWCQKDANTYIFPSVADVVLSYYYGPPGESLYRFNGPFKWGQAQTDRGGTLCPEQAGQDKFPDYMQTRFSLKLEAPIDKIRDAPVLVYDKAGRRHRSSLGFRFGSRLEDRGTDFEIRLGNIQLGEIETITIGEKPYEVWVKGIQVTPPGSEEETRNEMAEMARVFEIPDMKYEQVRDYDFGANPDKALRALPLLRGWELNAALRAVFPEKPRNLPPESLEQLHQIALELSQAPTPHWEQGIRMGIRGGWPEFYSMALDRLADPKIRKFLSLYVVPESDPFSLLYSLPEHPQELPDDLTPKIQKVIDVGDNSPSMELLKCLTDKKTSATTEALRALSRDERPMVWIAAFGELSKRQALAPEESLTPQEKIRLGVVRVLNGSWPNGVALDPEVESTVLSFLSDGRQYPYPTTVLNTLQRYGNREKSLRTAVEFLQKQDPYGDRRNVSRILSVVRWINLNYGVNIGESGNEMPTGYNNVRNDYEITPRQFEKAIADTVTWYEDGLAAGGPTPKQPIAFDFPKDYSVGTLENSTLGKFELQGRFEIPAGIETSITVRRKPDSFAFLDQFKSLRAVTLNIDADDFRETDFQYLRALASVQFLYIRSAKVTSAEIEILKGVPKLGSLQLRECRIETGCLGPIQDCASLGSLTFSGCQLSDAALASLRFPPQFHYLWLKSTPLSASAIEALKQLTGLKHLRLEKTGITTEKLEDLKRSLPDCEVSDPDREKATKEDSAPVQSAELQIQSKTGEKDGSGTTETTAPTSAPAAPPAFALYRLRSQRITAEEALQKPLAELELAEAPLLTDADIVTYYGSYYGSSHIIRLTAEAFARIPGRAPVGWVGSSGLPFVITVEGERIYCGVFKSILSSQSGPDCPTIGGDGMSISGEPRNTIAIGYNPKPQVPDPRADERIRNVLERIGKYQIWHNRPTSNSLSVHKVALDTEIALPAAKQLPGKFPDRSRSTTATALHILTPALLTVADLTSVTVGKTAPAGPSTVQIQFGKDVRERVLLELQHDRPSRAVVRDGRIYSEVIPESMGPPTPSGKYAHMLAVVQDGQILRAPIDPEALRSDWIPLVSLQSGNEAKALAQSIAVSLRAFQTPPQPETEGKEGNGVREMGATTSAPAAPPAFALYRLRSPLITAEEALQKPLDELELAETPFLTDADILTYYGPLHRIRLTAEAFARMPGTFPLRERASTYGTPFVITAQGERIYCGAFCTMISSQSGPDCPTIGDGFLYLHREPRNTIKIGYNPKPQVPDPRADERIRNVLERIGKYQTWYNPPASTSLRVHKVAWDIESDQPLAKQLPWRFPDSSRSNSATALHILTPTLLTVADLTSVTVVKTSPAGPSTVQVQFNKDARESVLLELQHDRPSRTFVRDGRTYSETVPESVGPPTPQDRYAHRLAFVQDDQILSAPIDPEALRSDWISLVSLQSGDEAKALAQSIAVSLRAFQTPPQSANGKGETTTSTTTTPTPVTPGEASPGEGTSEETETGNTSQSLKTQVPNGPLDIRFAGLQVGLGDSLYNQEGKKIGERVNWPYKGPSKTDMNWRFIFDLPGTEERPLFEEGAILYESGKDRKEGSVGGGMRCPEIETDGTSRQLLYEARIDFSSRGKKPPKAVDICVRYFSGPPREPLYTFSGPFEEGKTLEKQGATLSLKEYRFYNATSLFSFKAKMIEDGSFGREPSVLVSEKSGKRRLARWGSGGSRSDGTYREIQREIEVEGVPLEEIASITIGEKPLEFWVRNIQVAPSGAEEETKARLAEIARVLEVPCEDYENLNQYNFKANRDKALQCLPLLRGGAFYTVWNAITDLSNPIRMQDASPELRERIHQSALKLAKAPAPHCTMGVEMGLWGRWPEFYSLALEQHAGFFWISRRSAEIPEELIPRIQEILGTTENADEVRSWMTCLIDKQTSSTTEALRSLTKSERPWLWVPAYFQLWTRKALPPDETLSPQEKLRLATARAINDYHPSPDQEIGRGLVEMLTLEARRMTGRSFDFTNVVRGVHGYCDRETGTRALVDYIQKLGPDDRNPWEVEQVVHWINQDYGVNIGGLGVRPNHSPEPSSPRSPQQEKQLIADILTWQKTGVVPGGYVAEKPVVLEFPPDRSIGTIETGESGKFEMQGRIEIPAWASLRLDIKKKPDSVSVLEQFKSCRVLDLSIYGAGFRDEDFQFLRSFTTLQRLSFCGMDITGAGLENLIGLTNLTRLDFSSSRISGQGLGALQSCSSLKSLCLSYCQVTDAEMADLSGMPGLTTLLLEGTQISDASIKVLKQFQGLRVLNLEKTRITPQGGAELKKFLPNCNVSVPTAE